MKSGSKAVISASDFNILFTCAGRRVALLRDFRQAMEQLGITGRLLAVDITDTSPAYHLADEGMLVPPAGRVEYIPSLLEIVRKHEVKLIVPLTDLDLRSLARHREKFVKIGCTVMIGSEDAVMLCRDKARTNQMLAKAGLATINTYTLREFRSRPFYPFFIKPVRGSAGVGTGLIRSEQELRAHLATYGELMLIQDYVPGREFTIDVYRTRQGEVRAVVPRQRLMVRSGEVEKGITVHNKKLIEGTMRLADQMADMWGAFCCQCRWPEDGEPHFFEINPRFGGGAPLAIAAGANLPLYVLQETLGREVSGKVGEFKDNLLMLRYDDAIFTPVSDPSKLPGYDAPVFR